MTRKRKPKADNQETSAPVNLSELCQALLDAYDNLSDSDKEAVRSHLSKEKKDEP